MYEYITFPMQTLNNYRSQLHTPIMSIDDIQKMSYMKNIQHSAIELKENISLHNGYITPFSFYVRCMSGKQNNFSTPDPFAMIAYESEQIAFFNEKMPSIIFMPRLETLFSDSAPPPAYTQFLDKFLAILKMRNYYIQKNLTYWVVYSDS